MARGDRHLRRGLWRGATATFNPAGARPRPAHPREHPFHRDWANLGRDLRRAMRQEDAHARRR